MAYIGRHLDEAGLTRLDLATVGNKDSNHISATEFDVRATGDFNELVTFVKALESDARLAEFHNFVIKAPQIGNELEGRFNLTIYDPKTRQ